LGIPPLQLQLAYDRARWPLLFCSLFSLSRVLAFYFYRYGLFVHSSSHSLLLPGNRSFSEQSILCFMSSNLTPLGWDGARTWVLSPTAIAFVYWPRHVTGSGLLRKGESHSSFFFLPLWARCRGMKQFSLIDQYAHDDWSFSCLFLAFLFFKQCSF